MARGWNPTGCGRLVLLLFLNVHTGQTLNKLDPIPQGTDCTQIKSLNPRATSGIYTIKPEGVIKPFEVYCEMRLDGGWTVFQRRTGGAVSFSRKWSTYKCGFGKRAGDHWLGLRNVWAITKTRKCEWILRVEMCDFEGGTAYAEYRHFKLGRAKEQYRLSVGLYSGTAGDAIRGDRLEDDQNGYGFSTMDQDHDGCSPCIIGDIALNDCSKQDGDGGWWYSRCGSASLNGIWHPFGKHRGWQSGLHWHTWKGRNPYSMRATRMMVKSINYP